ncbi:GATA zinc finger domain-containing protein 14-like [Chrysoperla carnea]|uniref:GATA zinc finger domain-containing protein 14-like n=1 Tax=Chrysoperla carnea TaxID=189513 RepID=UPI001D08E65B|nr:GATA zinc finger domain-containing protein 14-like [Chrysoperla carnea]
MKILISLICSIFSICNYTVLVVGKPTPENPLRGNLFKLNSNATSKLRNIYSNYAMPGTLHKGNERDNLLKHSIDMRNYNKSFKKLYNEEYSKVTPDPERSSYKPYVYEIEAVLFENDTSQEKPVTRIYDFDQEVTSSRNSNNENNHNKSFNLDESRAMNAAVTGSTNATKTLMSYITQNMNQTMSQLRDNKQHKVKTLFNYAIDLKTDPVTGGFPFTVTNNNSNQAPNNHNSNINLNHHSGKNNNHRNKPSNHYNNNDFGKVNNEQNIFANTKKATMATFKPQKTDFHNFFENLMATNAENGRTISDTQTIGRENEFVLPYDYFDYESNNSPKQFQVK